MIILPYFSESWLRSKPVLLTIGYEHLKVSKSQSKLWSPGFFQNTKRNSLS